MQKIKNQTKARPRMLRGGREQHWFGRKYSHRERVVRKEEVMETQTIIIMSIIFFVFFVLLSKNFLEKIMEKKKREEKRKRREKEEKREREERTSLLQDKKRWEKNMKEKRIVKIADERVELSSPAKKRLVKKINKKIEREQITFAYMGEAYPLPLSALSVRKITLTSSTSMVVEVDCRALLEGHDFSSKTKVVLEDCGLKPLKLALARIVGYRVNDQFSQFLVSDEEYNLIREKHPYHFVDEDI